MHDLEREPLQVNAALDGESVSIGRCFLGERKTGCERDDNGDMPELMTVSDVIKVAAWLQDFRHWKGGVQHVCIEHTVDSNVRLKP